MKIAEALLLRADLQRKIKQLVTRSKSVALVQEGKQPQEDPLKLLAQLRESIKELEKIVVKINRTNIVTLLPDGRTLMEGLAHRDALKSLSENLKSIREAAQLRKVESRFERRTNNSNMEATVKLKDLQNELDQVGRSFRKIDTQIQSLNWSTDLID